MVHRVLLFIGFLLLEVAAAFTPSLNRYTGMSQSRLPSSLATQRSPRIWSTGPRAMLKNSFIEEVGRSQAKILSILSRTDTKMRNTQVIIYLSIHLFRDIYFVSAVIFNFFIANSYASAIDGCDGIPVMYDRSACLAHWHLLSDTGSPIDLIFFSFNVTETSFSEPQRCQ